MDLQSCFNEHTLKCLTINMQALLSLMVSSSGKQIKALHPHYRFIKLQYVHYMTKELPMNCKMMFKGLLMFYSSEMI